ncbi:hypothetical protein RJ639_026134 [Escallonia herrerae]|nr:hypothetical protein RJ639_026134 [Escallonia herrerae]
MQECHPVAYESRKLNKAERHYTTHEKELLAVVHCLIVRRHYLLGSTNGVVDALSRRAKLDQVALIAMKAIVRADSQVAINIGRKIRKALTRDPIV